MRSRNIIVPAIAAALALSWATASTAAPASRWIKAQSEHFTVYSDNGEQVTRAYLLRLEQYRYILARLYGLRPENEASMPNIDLYFVATKDDMQATVYHDKLDADGYFTYNSGGQFMVSLYYDDLIRQTQKATSQDENHSQVILFHEYAHDFMFHNSDVRYPPWFVEGFADYYGATKIQGSQAVIGMATESRLRSLARTALTYEEVLRSDKAVWQDDLYITNEFYARGWMLTHYILSDADRRARFGAYLEAYGRGEDPVAAFETTFGIKIKDLPRVLDTYYKHLQATVYTGIKDMPVSTVTISPMPPSANKLLLWDAAILTQSGKPARQDLLAEIRAEAAKYPGDDYAQLVLAHAEVAIGDESQTVGFLTAFTTAHPDDSKALSLLGQAYYLMTRHKHINAGETAESQMQKARAALLGAYKLDPKNATNLYYLSLAQRDLPGYPNQTAVDAVVQAHNLAPAVATYSILAAQLLATRDRLPEARTMLYVLANDPHNHKLGEWAQAIITAIDAGARKEDIISLLQKGPNAKPAS